METQKQMGKHIFICLMKRKNVRFPDGGERGVSLLTNCSIGFPHILSPTRTRFWGSHECVLCSRGSQHSRVC